MQNINKEKIITKLKLIQSSALQKGIDKTLIRRLNFIYFSEQKKQKHFMLGLNNNLLISAGFAAFLTVVLAGLAVDYLLNARCLLPINHLVWEATRPLADCSYCANVTKPITLQNITRQNFRTYAYSSKPIIVKNAVNHWRAIKEFNFNFFKKLYDNIAGSYDSLEEGCQFLNFKTDLFTLKEIFQMPSARVHYEPGQKPWYVGWSNCHPDIQTKMREYYEVPEFLPEDAELPASENLFFGYEMGAVMHLDYIPRLMWQGQVKGSKNWSVVPVPECEDVCHEFEFYVEPGDVVLLDTRVWYHSTSIPKGQFSLTVQSEYG